MKQDVISALMSCEPAVEKVYPLPNEYLQTNNQIIQTPHYPNSLEVSSSDVGHWGVLHSCLLGVLSKYKWAGQPL